MLWKRLLCVSVMVVMAASAGATTVLPVDLASMVDSADLIFVGTVIGSESVPTKDGSYAFTYVTFDVEQALKGVPRAGKTVTLRLAGGQVGSDVFTVEGAPAFALGGRHLLFVEGNDRYLVPLVGMFQGKLDFVESPTSHEPILVDYAGNAVDGIGAKNWHRGGMKLNRDGSLRQPEGAGAAVVSEQGVKIRIEQPKLVDHATPAGQILGQLRAYINSRKASSPGFKNTQFVDSASKANVPATFGFTAGRAPSVNDK